MPEIVITHNGTSTCRKCKGTIWPGEKRRRGIATLKDSSTGGLPIPEWYEEHVICPKGKR